MIKFQYMSIFRILNFLQFCELLEESMVKLVNGSDQNRVPDCVAKYSRTESCTAIRLQRGPRCIEDLLLEIAMGWRPSARAPIREQTQ